MPSSAPVYSPPITVVSALPKLVAAMRARILQACRTGDIEALRVPIDRNEVRPLFEKSAHRDPGADPVETLKRLSFDGNGREMLALLRAVLSQACLREVRGPVTMYVWPAFTISPPKDPTPDERQVMLTCLRFADLGRIDGGRAPYMRLGIGADGMWHYFWNEAG